MVSIRTRKVQHSPLEVQTSLCEKSSFKERCSLIPGKKFSFPLFFLLEICGHYDPMVYVLFVTKVFFEKFAVTRRSLN